MALRLTHLTELWALLDQARPSSSCTPQQWFDWLLAVSRLTQSRANTLKRQYADRATLGLKNPLRDATVFPHGTYEGKHPHEVPPTDTHYLQWFLLYGKATPAFHKLVLAELLARPRQPLDMPD